MKPYTSNIWRFLLLLVCFVYLVQCQTTDDPDMASDSSSFDNPTSSIPLESSTSADLFSTPTPTSDLMTAETTTEPTTDFPTSTYDEGQTGSPTPDVSTDFGSSGISSAPLPTSTGNGNTECTRSCLSEAASGISCDVSDIGCICSDSTTFYDRAQECMRLASCNTADADQAIIDVGSQCNDWSATAVYSSSEILSTPYSVDSTSTPSTAVSTTPVATTHGTSQTVTPTTKTDVLVVTVSQIFTVRGSTFVTQVVTTTRSGQGAQGGTSPAGSANGAISRLSATGVTMISVGVAGMLLGVRLAL